MNNPSKRYSNHEAYSPGSKVQKSPEEKKKNAKVADIQYSVCCPARVQANTGRSQIKEPTCSYLHPVARVDIGSWKEKYFQPDPYG